MVDALERAVGHLRPRGILVDLRPDGAREARLLSRGRVIGRIVESEEARGDDACADEAAAEVVRRGLVRHVGRGLVWHQTSFASAAELSAYVRDSPRYGRLSPGSRARIPRRDPALALRRAIKFALFARR